MSRRVPSTALVHGATLALTQLLLGLEVTRSDRDRIVHSFPAALWHFGCSRDPAIPSVRVYSWGPSAVSARSQRAKPPPS